MLIGPESEYAWLFSRIDANQLLANCIKIVMGVWLLLGARGLAGVLRSYRDYGRKFDSGEVSSENSKDY